MSNWITDRRPTIVDSDMAGFVWVTTEYGTVLTQHWAHVYDRPWMPIPKIVPPEPYVKPKRYTIRCYGDFGLVGPAGYWCVYDTATHIWVSDFMPLEAAERIAATYEEVMP